MASIVRARSSTKNFRSSRRRPEVTLKKKVHKYFLEQLFSPMVFFQMLPPPLFLQLPLSCHEMGRLTGSTAGGQLHFCTYMLRFGMSNSIFGVPGRNSRYSILIVSDLHQGGLRHVPGTDVPENHVVGVLVVWQRPPKMMVVALAGPVQRIRCACACAGGGFPEG